MSFFCHYEKLRFGKTLLNENIPIMPNWNLGNVSNENVPLVIVSHFYLNDSLTFLLFLLMDSSRSELSNVMRFVMIRDIHVTFIIH